MCVCCGVQKTTPTPTTNPNESAPTEPAPSLSNGPGGKFYLRSKTIIGGLVVAVPQVLRIFGWELADCDAQLIGDSALTALGAVLILWGRLTATQPLRLRRSRQDHTRTARRAK